MYSPHKPATAAMPAIIFPGVPSGFFQNDFGEKLLRFVRLVGVLLIIVSPFLKSISRPVGFDTLSCRITRCARRRPRTSFPLKVGLFTRRWKRAQRSTALKLR